MYGLAHWVGFQIVLVCFLAVCVSFVSFRVLLDCSCCFLVGFVVLRGGMGWEIAFCFQNTLPTECLLFHRVNAFLPLVENAPIYVTPLYPMTPSSLPLPTLDSV